MLGSRRAFQREQQTQQRPQSGVDLDVCSSHMVMPHAPGHRCQANLHQAIGLTHLWVIPYLQGPSPPVNSSDAQSRVFKCADSECPQVLLARPWEL